MASDGAADEELEPVVNIVSGSLRHVHDEPDRREHGGEDVPVQGVGGDDLAVAVRPPRKRNAVTAVNTRPTMNSAIIVPVMA